MKAYFVEVFDLVDICLRNKILSEAKKELKRVFFFFLSPHIVSFSEISGSKL